LDSVRKELRERFLSSGDAAALQAGLTQATDRAVGDAFEASALAALPVAVFAGGRYGRGDLFPCSDADIVVLCEPETFSPALTDAVSEFLSLLRRGGIRPNHRVSTIDEAAAFRGSNLDGGIVLLHQRPLAGDGNVQAKAERELAALFSKHAEEFCGHVGELAQARHKRFRNTAFHLQPDVKETPGGCRDLNVISRLSKLSPGHFPAEEGIDEAARFVVLVRCFLHYATGDDVNVLDTASQREFAATVPGFSMRTYYEAARKIFNATRRALEAFDKSSSLLDSFRGLQSRLSNNEFTVAREHVFLRRSGELASDPMMALRLAEFMAHHGLAAAAETERRLEAERAALAAWGAGTQPLWPGLKSTLCQPGAPVALRALRDTGALGVVFPEYSTIEGMAPEENPDLRYTSGERALIAVEKIGELRRPAQAPGQKFAELASEIEDVPALLFAVLLRECGAEGALQAARRIQMPETTQAVVEFLIAHRLDLTDAAISRDVADPATLRRLADRVGTLERLKLLTVFTYAWMCSDGNETAVRLQLEELWHTYAAIQHELLQELETDRITGPPEDLSAHAAFLKGFPQRYLRSRTATDIQADVQLYEQSRPTGVAVNVERVEEAYKLTIAARDAPFLFASLAGAISSLGLNILKAEAFSNSRGTVLDNFVFADPKGKLGSNPEEMERLYDLIQTVALGKTDTTRLLRTRPRPDPKKRTIIPDVRFDSEACDTATLVEIVAEDRPGLLHNLAMAFSASACNIDIVLVDTKGRRAIDVFYVAHDGRKLSPEMQERLKEKILEVC
jgi:[protein-PII] uridylyltransferase